MPTMSTQGWINLGRDLMRTADCPGGITKQQPLAVIAAIDDTWNATVAAEMNNAIPQPQRGIMTTKQKAALFMLYLNAQYFLS